MQGAEPELDHQALLHEFRETIIQTLGGLIEPGADFALLDFPHHTNVGDSVIWLGELAFFRKVARRDARYVCSKDTFDKDALLAACPEGPIFLHGGGNFGDLWPAHQLFRERVVEAFPDRPIIQLPQSIHFQDQASLERARKVIHGHGDFTLIVRDRQSLERAQAAFSCPVVLCPDMALFLGVTATERVPYAPLIALLRGDKEKREQGLRAALRKDVPRWDWLVTLKRIEPLLQWLPPLGRAASWERLATLNAYRGLNMLANGRAVVTDRLHAHILSLQLGLPHLVLDNSYGKISSFIETWTGRSPLVRLARTAAEVRAWQDELLGPA